MINFRLGQKVICIKEDNYIDDVTNLVDNGNAPKKNEIVTINDIHHYGGKIYLQLKEYLYNNGRRNYINSINFRPIKYNSSTSEILEKFKLTEEKSDVEIRKLETIGCSPISEGRATNE